jgi:hypothetical protein
MAQSRAHAGARGHSGFRRGRRYVAISGAPEFFNLYEADTPEVLGGKDYLDRLNAPTPWTRRVVPSFRNVARSICRVAFTSGVGSGGVVLTLRFDVGAQDRAAAIEALTTRALPPISLRRGIAGVHLCLADEAISNVETAEKKARADATLVPAWIVLVEGVDADVVRAAGDALAPALRLHAGVAPRPRSTGMNSHGGRPPKALADPKAGSA